MFVTIEHILHISDLQTHRCSHFPKAGGVQDQNGNLPADSILALLSQAGDYEVDTFHVPW